MHQTCGPPALLAFVLAAMFCNSAARLPASWQGQQPSELVVGTLDLNQGAKLPAEELVGRRPAEGDRVRLRAYLSNVCVAEAARRQVREAAAELQMALRGAFPTARTTCDRNPLPLTAPSTGCRASPEC